MQRSIIVAAGSIARSADQIFEHGIISGAPPVRSITGDGPLLPDEDAIHRPRVMISRPGPAFTWPCEHMVQSFSSLI